MFISQLWDARVNIKPDQQIEMQPQRNGRGDGEWAEDEEDSDDSALDSEDETVPMTIYD